VNNFSVAERRIGGVTVLDIRGKLRGCGGGATLRNAINRPLEEGHDLILLNLANVSDIDSSCMSVLVSSHFDLNKKGGELKIVSLSRNLRELMTLTKLLTVFDVYEDESEALKSFRSPPHDPAGPPASPPKTYHAPLPACWGALGMILTFRAELMQGRSRLLRTFSVRELLPSGRVTLNGISGEFAEATFEHVRYAA
jgi:anti-sigma B factor antagonist